MIDLRFFHELMNRLQWRLAHPLDRRQFLKLQARCAALTCLSVSGISIPTLLYGQAYPDIAVAKGGPGPAARAAVALVGGMKRFVKPGNKVVIKPNMSFAFAREPASNTSPELVRELVAMAREAGASRVRVLDHPLRSSELCIEGVKDACAVFDEDIVQGVDQGRFFRETPIPDGKSFKKTEVMKDVLEADVLIAAPVAKSHSSTGVSLSMKGMMGLIWNRSVMHYRYDLSTAIVDLNSLLKPDLVVIDATRVLSTNGPAGPGEVLSINSVIASADMVAADAQAVALCQWYGRKMEPRQVKHILLAHERGLGRMDIENLRIKTIDA